MTHARRLRELLRRPEPVVAIGAHDALSAKLAATEGFEAIWASGFGISAVNAVPDANILTMTETLEAVKRMIEAAPIPVIADCDSGYGNAINVMRTVREFSREGAAGLCLEDNIFPKRCSFYGGVQRELVPTEEHADKIRAAISAKADPDFVIIARTEALIAGYGFDEALTRARAYADAGADAVLVHSKAKTFDELREFTTRWKQYAPLVAVPTIYRDVTLTELARHGFVMAIFANQLLRGSIRAMRETLATLRETGCLASVEDRIVPLSDVYELVGLKDLQRNEREYLGQGSAPTAVILAAGFEPELMPLTHDRPKGMLEVHGRSILEHQLRALREAGIQDIVIVRGHQKYAIDFPGVRYYDNERFRDTGELQSLLCARESLGGPFLFLYSDILFDRAILPRLLRSTADISLVVDRALCDQPAAEGAARPADLVSLETRSAPGYRFMPAENGTRIRRVARQMDRGDADGEFIGMALFSAVGSAALRAVCDVLATRSGPFHEAPSVSRAGFTDLIQEMIDHGHDVRAIDIYKGWMDVNTFDDYQRAWEWLRQGELAAAPERTPAS